MVTTETSHMPPAQQTALDAMKFDAAICNAKMRRNLGPGMNNTCNIRTPGPKTIQAALLLTGDWQSTAGIAAQMPDFPRQSALSAMNTLECNGVADSMRAETTGTPKLFRRGPDWATKLREWGVPV